MKQHLQLTWVKWKLQSKPNSKLKLMEAHQRQNSWHQWMRFHFLLPNHQWHWHNLSYLCQLNNHHFLWPSQFNQLLSITHKFHQLWPKFWPKEELNPKIQEILPHHWAHLHHSLHLLLLSNQHLWSRKQLK